MQADLSLPKLLQSYKLLIFDVDGTITVPHTNQLLPGRKEFFSALGREYPDSSRPLIALATNQGGVGFRHWLETERPDWLTEKSIDEQIIEIAIYPTQIEAEDRLTEIAGIIASAIGGYAAWPTSYSSYAWQFKGSRLWAPIPPEEEGNLRWSKQWRKPAPGMLKKAMNDFNVPPRHTLMIRDQISDIQAGKAARCATAWASDFFGETVSLTTLVDLYLKGQLPPNITLHIIKYREKAFDKYYLAANVPKRLQEPLPEKLPDNTKEEIDLKLIPSGKRTVLAGYSEASKTLLIGVKEETE